MNDLRAELDAATKARKIAGQQCADARRIIIDAKKHLRRTDEYKRLKAAKETLKMRESAYTRACDTVFAVNDELLTGQTRLPLWDAAASNGNGNGRAAAMAVSTEGIAAKELALERKCRKCGCTDSRACPDDGTGDPCHWVEYDLCSACVDRPAVTRSNRTNGHPRRQGPRKAAVAPEAVP